MEGHSDQNYGSDYLKVVDNNYGYSQRYKGVVAQHNGHWGAQIYTNNQRIWLGTFKSEIDAAIAYDRASIKLRSADAPRNFPWTETTLQEANFQSLHDTGRLLAIIKDGSYQSKFDDFRRQNLGKVDGDYNKVSPEKGYYGYSCRVLFQKELTPSDVGKLNRLVIPKKYAVRYFPPVPEESEAGFSNDEVHLSFYDPQKRLWKFRYCYWKSSQSFVFTRGWNQFVKEKKLMAMDKITFYYHENLEIPNTGFWVIDASLSSSNLQLGTNIKRLGVEGEEISFKDHGMELLEDEAATTTTTTAQKNNIVETKGLKLFGVQIIG